VYGSDDVKAQIKLQCKTVTGQPFLVIRSFQLTRKRSTGKYEFKSLDQNIQICKQNGEVWRERGRVRRRRLTRPSCLCQLEGLSKRCADINLEVPQLLGVSKVCWSACSACTPMQPERVCPPRPSWRMSSLCTRTIQTGELHGRGCRPDCVHDASIIAVAGRWRRGPC
jgi:hypothetical protein